MNQIADRLQSGALKAFMNDAGFDRAAILLFIRDPLDHLSSHYQQVVKRAGETKSLEAWARSYDTPKTVATAMQVIDEAPFAIASIWNYSRMSEQLLALTSAWLDLP